MVNHSSTFDFVSPSFLQHNFSYIFGRRSVGEKRCPKLPTATPTIHLPVAVVASYVAWRADQVLYGSYTLDIDSDNVGSCIFVQDHTLGGETKYD